jgi:hypothetical protein
MADALHAGHWLLRQQAGQSGFNLALSFADVQDTVVQHRQPGAVVTTVLQPPQSFEENGTALFSSDISDYPAHGLILSRGV